MSLRGESRRLKRAFGTLLLALGPAAAAQACSGPARTLSSSPGSPDARQDDRAAQADANAPREAPSPINATCTLVTQVLGPALDAATDADVHCRYTLPCGLPDGSAFVIRGCGLYRAEVEDGGDASLGCEISEADGCKSSAYAAPAGGAVSFECYDCLGGGGRRPRGLRPARAAPPPPSARADRAAAPSPIGSYFAGMAREEAASVHAFVRMHAELHELGAPRPLVQAAAGSARDERRHAHLMTRCASKFGRSVAPVRVRRQSVRTLEAMARENVVEGCIRETYGALLMCWQAAHASDPSLKRVFARLALDETRHAALSWEVARWAEARLDARARVRVRAAQTRALRALKQTLETSTAARGFASADGARLGYPGPAQALALLDGLVAQLSLG